MDGWEETGRIDAVYNLEVEQDHTYFVGAATWSFSVWSHNTQPGNPCAAPTRPHYAEWTLEGPHGGVIANGEEFSGVEFPLEPGERLTFPEQSWYGHTEGKIISDLMDEGELRPGRRLTIEGERPPCPNCQNTMKWASGEFQMEIVYFDGEMNSYWWKNGKFIGGP